MQSFAPGRVTGLGFTVCTVAILLSGCSTPSKLTPERLASLGVNEAAIYWDAEQKLVQEGYHCYVSGAKREKISTSRSKQALFQRVFSVFSLKSTTRIRSQICTSRTRHVSELRNCACRCEFLVLKQRVSVRSALGRKLSTPKVRILPKAACCLILEESVGADEVVIEAADSA